MLTTAGAHYSLYDIAGVTLSYLNVPKVDDSLHNKNSSRNNIQANVIIKDLCEILNRAFELQKGMIKYLTI